VKFSVVINTIALAPDADRVSSGGRPYAERAWLLRNVILPWYASLKVFDRVIVAGEWEEGPHHTYVPCPQVRHDVSDALAARDAGVAALADGADEDWVLFQHDDHLWSPANPDPRDLPADQAVISPSRLCRSRNPLGEALNDGHEGGYINGHAVLMRLGAVRKVPWVTAAPVFTWDKEYTRALRAAGYAPAYTRDLVVWDMERDAQPWEQSFPYNYLRAADHGALESYRSGSTEPWTADVVVAIARAIHASVVVETGTFEGKTTMALWDGMRDQNNLCELHTVESDKTRLHAAHAAIGAHMEAHPGSSQCVVACHGMDALEYLTGLPEGQADLVFVDDDHGKQHVRREVVAALRALRPRGVLCLHDVCGSFDLAAVVREHGGVVLDFPRLHTSGGLGVIVK